MTEARPAEVSATQSVERRIAALSERARTAPPAVIDWTRPPQLPPRFRRRTAARAITQYYRGEIGTAAACDLLRARLVLPAAREFLALQAADERRHAGLYRAYLERIGGIDPRASAIGAACARALSWDGAPEGIMLFFHVLLEGESLRLQRALAQWMPCPLFAEIGAAIARDEARHVAFGRLYLRHALPRIARDERLAMLGWVRALWHSALGDGAAGIVPAGPGARARWLEDAWRERLDDFQSVRLFPPEERPLFAGV